jgi:hypothetical protein
VDQIEREVPWPWTLLDERPEAAADRIKAIEAETGHLIRVRDDAIRQTIAIGMKLRNLARERWLLERRLDARG